MHAPMLQAPGLCCPLRTALCLHGQPAQLAPPTTDWAPTLQCCPSGVAPPGQARLPCLGQPLGLKPRSQTWPSLPSLHVRVLPSAFSLQASALHLSGCTREPPACSRAFLAPPLALPPAHSSAREWTGLLLTTYPAGLPPRTKDRLCPFLPQVPSHNSRERSELKTRQVVRTSSAPDLSDPRPPPWRLGN